MDATFSSPNLPHWLTWDNGILNGVPPDNANSISIDVVAEYGAHRLIQNFTIAVVGEDGVRALATESLPASKSGSQTEHLQASTGTQMQSSMPGDLNPGAPGMMGQSYYTHAPGSLLPSAMPTMSLENPVSPPHARALQKLQVTSSGMNSPVPNSPTSSQPSQFVNGVNTQPIPFYLPTSPTDATTLASASHIKAKLVEQTTAHHENMRALNSSHRAADSAKVEAAVEAAINHQIAVTAQIPSMPSATEVFNATLEVSARSQQMQQNQLTQAVAVVTGMQPDQQMQLLQPTLIPQNQVANQLAGYPTIPPPVSAAPDAQLAARQYG